MLQPQLTYNKSIIDFFTSLYCIDFLEPSLWSGYSTYQRCHMGYPYSCTSCDWFIYMRDYYICDIVTWVYIMSIEHHWMAIGFPQEFHRKSLYYIFENITYGVSIWISHDVLWISLGIYLRWKTGWTMCRFCIIMWQMLI